jgi:hypothetical protein
MLLAQLGDQFLYVKLSTESGVELANSNFDIGTERFKCGNPLEKLKADLLLRCLRKLRSFGQSKL